MKTTNYYDYEKNISVVTTPNGDKVITMNKQIFTLLCNHLYDASELQLFENHTATSEDTTKLWRTLSKKEEESK